MTTFFTIISIILLSISLFFPAFIFEENNIFPGWGAFIFGALGLFANCFVWYANPFLFGALITYKKFKNYYVSLILSIISLSIAATLPLYDVLPKGSAGSYPFEIGMGYYIWLLSIMTIVIASIFGVIYNFVKKP